MSSTLLPSTSGRWVSASSACIASNEWWPGVTTSLPRAIECHQKGTERTDASTSPTSASLRITVVAFYRRALGGLHGGALQLVDLLDDRLQLPRRQAANDPFHQPGTEPGRRRLGKAKGGQPAERGAGHARGGRGSGRHRGFGRAPPGRGPGPHRGHHFLTVGRPFQFPGVGRRTSARRVGDARRLAHGGRESFVVVDEHGARARLLRETADTSGDDRPVVETGALDDTRGP